MYTVTNDFKRFVTLQSLNAAKHEADEIKGGVYTFPNNEPLCVYSYKDDLLPSGTYLAGGVRRSCSLELLKHTNKYFWDIFGHNDHYNTVEEAIASLPSFIKTL